MYSAGSIQNNNPINKEVKISGKKMVTTESKHQKNNYQCPITERKGTG